MLPTVYRGEGYTVMGKRWFDRENVAEILTFVLVGAGFAYQLIRLTGPFGLFFTIAAVIYILQTVLKRP